jgi:hypothetical protein
MDPRGRSTGERAGRSRRPAALGTIGEIVREPVIAIMITAGIFELLSGGAISHGVLLIVGALVVGWDRLRRRQRAEIPTVSAPAYGLLAFARGIPAWLGVVVAVSYAAVVGTFARFTWPATIAILALGAVAILAVWRDRAPRPPAPHLPAAGTIAWLAVLVGLGLWELTQLLLQPGLRIDSYAHPTISVMMDPLLNRHHLDRSIGILLWLLLGWYLVDR